MENTQIFFLVLSTVLVLGVAALWWVLFELRKKVKILFGDEHLSSDNELLKNLVQRITRLELTQGGFAPRLDEVERLSKISVHKVGFLRFNPFQDTGGDQSFILVLLDGKNDGVIITSLYAREGVRVYGKEITAGAPKQPLSEEEKRVLEDTMSKKTKT